MHEVTSQHWHQPEGYKNAGYGAWNRPDTPYDDYMQALRLIGWYGPNNHRKDKAGVPGEKRRGRDRCDRGWYRYSVLAGRPVPAQGIRRDAEERGRDLENGGVALPRASESVISIQR
jgi:hypothetical protein